MTSVSTKKQLGDMQGKDEAAPDHVTDWD